MSAVQYLRAGLCRIIATEFARKQYTSKRSEGCVNPIPGCMGYKTVGQEL